MSEWRDMNRIPKGMSDFQRWFRPEGVNPRIAPSDVDGILHTLNGNRFIMFEFKPEQASLTTGQRITMEGFSKKEGCVAVAVFDPFSQDTSRERYNDDLELLLQVFHNGKSSRYVVTLQQLNQAITAWFDGTGPLTRVEDVLE